MTPAQFLEGVTLVKTLYAMGAFVLALILLAVGSLFAILIYELLFKDAIHFFVEKFKKLTKTEFISVIAIVATFTILGAAGGGTMGALTGFGISFAFVLFIINWI